MEQPAVEEEIIVPTSEPTESVEHILTPEEEEAVRQFAEAQEELKEAVAALTGTFENETARREAKYRVSDKIAAALLIGLPILGTAAVYAAAAFARSQPGSMNEGVGLSGLEYIVGAGMGGSAGVIVSGPLILACRLFEGALRSKRLSEREIMDIQEQIRSQVGEYEKQVALSRGIVSDAMIRGGATVDLESGTLTATEAQIEDARKEMEMDLARNEKPE